MSQNQTTDAEFHVPALVYWIGAPFLRLSMLIESRRGVLKPLEHILIDAAVAAMPADPAQRLRTQLGEINHAKRVTSGSTETVFYRIRGIRPFKGSIAPLQVPAGEYALATVRFRLGAERELAATLWTLDGRLVTLEFSADVERNLDRTDAQVTAVTLAMAA